MISIVGTKTSIIGFGLCGVDDVHEVAENETKEKIKEAIQQCGDVVLIDEFLTKDLNLKQFDKTFIIIPWRFKVASDDDEIEKLVQDALGVAI